MLGLSKRWGVGKKFKEVLNFESYVPPEGYVDPPEPIATEPYHERPVWVTNPGENPLDVEYMCGLARKHFSAEKAAFAVQSFRKGFLDSYTGPPYTQALTSNRIEPGDPGTAEVGEQLLRIAEEGQLYCSRLPVAGTRIPPMDILSKIRPDGKEKLRVTCNGKYPGGDMIQHSRKAWTPRTHVSYSQDSSTLQMARYMYHPPRCSIVSDLKNAFEKLKKHPHEIAANCLRWDPGQEMWTKLMEHVVWTGSGPREPGGAIYWYSAVHLFGLSGTPAVANLSFGLVALEQLEVARTFDPHATLSRRTDDTMITLTQHVTDAQVEECAKACFRVNERSGHVLQTKKTEVNETCPRFDGFLWCFATQRVGLPEDKGKAIGAMIAAMLRGSDQGRYRSVAESLQGKLEHVATAIPTVLRFIVAFRHCWIKLKHDRDVVNLSQEARADLQRLARLLRDGQDRLWFKFGQHFIDGAPAIVFATDASGLAHKGFGGYVVPGPRTLEQSTIRPEAQVRRCTTRNCPCDSSEGTVGEACCDSCGETGRPCLTPLHTRAKGQRCVRDGEDSTCVTEGCRCVSYNGAPNEVCSDVCAKYGPCALPYHLVPFRRPRVARAGPGEGESAAPAEPAFFAMDTKWRHIVGDTAVITEDRHSSGLLELIACYAMIEASTWSGSTLLRKTDSKVARDAWRKGRSSSILMNRIVKRIAYALAKRSCVLVVEHLSRETHIIQLADHLSRQKRFQFGDGLPELGRSQGYARTDFKCPTAGVRAWISQLLSTQMQA